MPAWVEYHNSYCVSSAALRLIFKRRNKQSVSTLRTSSSFFWSHFINQQTLDKNLYNIIISINGQERPVSLLTVEESLFPNLSRDTNWLLCSTGGLTTLQCTEWDMCSVSNHILLLVHWVHYVLICVVHKFWQLSVVSNRCCSLTGNNKIEYNTLLSFCPLDMKRTKCGTQVFV